MKKRILDALSVFKQGGPALKEHHLAKELSAELSIDFPEISKKADEILTYILHHYTDFSVSTIDRFNHKILKTFALELGLNPNFSPETDQQFYLEMAVDNLLKRSGEDKELTDLMLKYIYNLLEDEKSWNVRPLLVENGRDLFNESSIRQVESLKSASIAEFRKAAIEFNKRKKNAIQKRVETAKEVLSIIEREGDIEDFLTGGRRYLMINFFKSASLPLLKINAPSESLIKAMQNGELYIKSAPVSVKQKIENLTPFIQEKFKLVEELTDALETVSILEEKLFATGVLHETSLELDKIKNRQHLVFISEFNRMISQLISTEEAPYIYERLGQRFQHIMIDEFQDTSILQWRNILPLVENSLSKSKVSLLVGDPKQSIYRWRNGEVRQFNSLPSLFPPALNQTEKNREKTLHISYENFNLKTNRRSRKNIVEFNNLVFGKVSEAMPDYYHDAVQETEFCPSGGIIMAQITNEKMTSKEYEEWACQQSLEAIKTAVENGFKLSDVAVLTRTRKQASAISAFLLSKEIQVISSESLLIHNDEDVRFLVNWLTASYQPDNEIVLHSLKLYCQNLFDELLPESKISTIDELIELLKPHGLDGMRHLMHYSPYLLASGLCEIFELNKKHTPFIEAFLGHALQKQHMSHREFIEWWMIHQNNVSLQVTEQPNAVQVMTIHKSKGLEFPVVLVPFLFQKPPKQKYIWINHQEENIREIQYWKVPLSPRLGSLGYQNLVDEENKQTQADKFNLMYVAFTRACDALIVFYQANESKSEEILQVDNELKLFEQKDKWKIRGEWPLLNEKTQYNKGIPEEQRELKSGLKSVKSFLNWPKYTLTVDLPANETSTGTAFHDWIKKIRYRNEIWIKLPDENFNFEEDWLKKFDSFCAKSPLINFFSENFDLKIEEEFYNRTGKILRPDRVYLNHTLKKAGLLDFKTGKKDEKHLLQLKEYISGIEEMGYEVECACLWYLPSFNLINEEGNEFVLKD